MRLFTIFSALSITICASAYEIINDTSKVEILTPSFKARKTAKIKLDNGLEVYIISDPLLKESGAALSVEVGSWNDPVEYPGMAHFLEHMLFMGTKAYPDEAEYSSFIQSHGGAMNAYTASDKTVYSFTINPQDFEGALDRFSHFFIDPLFSRNSISRELHNVDQEHAKNVENDGSRVYQVFKDTSNTSHPNHAFSTGNADTLSGIPQDVMKAFYEKYYSADAMHLVIMDKAPLDTLIAQVNNKFSKVPVSNYKRTLPTQSMLSTMQKGSLLKIQPLRNIKSLSLVWEIDDQFVSDFNSMSASFLSYLVSSEAKGQLADQLKTLGYVNQLTSSVDVFSPKQGLISIDLDLTDKGLEKTDEVIKACQSYLNFLSKQSDLSSIFNQWKSIIATRFTYQDRQDVFDQVTNMAADLTFEPISSYPAYGTIPDSFNQAQLTSLIKTLTPQHCLFILLSGKGSFDKVEPWTGAKYSLTPYNEQTLVSFESKDSLVNFQTLELNPYAPSDFYIVDTENEVAAYETLASTQNFNFYYKPTNAYGLPELCLKVRMTPTLMMPTAELNAFMNLYTQAFQKSMMFDLDAASYCGLKGALSYSDGSLWLNLEGFNDKALALASKMIDNIQNFSFSKEDFELIKQTVKDNLSNTSKELGFRQGFMRFNALFDSLYSLPYEVNLVLKEWDYAKFMDTCLKLKSNLALNGLLIGNASKQTADNLKDKLSKLVSKKEVPSSNLIQVLDLDEQKGPYIYKKNLEVQGSSLILAIQQEKTNTLSKAKTALLMPVVSEQFFDTLRTKQHTGYIARALDTEISLQQFYLFAVQSNSHGSLELLYRFELFIEDFVNNFDMRYSQEQFESIKQSLIQEITARKENLSTLASHDMRILCYRDGDFTWDDKLVAAIKSTNYEELKEFAFATMPRANKKRVAFMMEGKLPENRKLNYTPTTLDVIRKEGEFSLPQLLLPQEESDAYSKKLLQSAP